MLNNKKNGYIFNSINYRSDVSWLFYFHFPWPSHSRPFNPVCNVHTYALFRTLYMIGIFSEFWMDSQTIYFSDRNSVPKEMSGTSDGIGFFSEFRSEGATKLTHDQKDALLEKQCTQ